MNTVCKIECDNFDCPLNYLVQNSGDIEVGVTIFTSFDDCPDFIDPISGGILELNFDDEVY